MWENSSDHCSMLDTPTAWQIATLRPTKEAQRYREEIMQNEFPLLKLKGQKLVSFGLKKEAAKQRKRRLQMQEAAKARWNKALTANPNGCTSNAKASSMQCFPFLYPFLYPYPKLRNVLKDMDGKKSTEIQKAAQTFLINCGELMGSDKRCMVSKEQILQDKSTLVSLAIFICTNYGMGEWNNQLDRAYNSLEEQIDNKDLRRPMAAFTSAGRRMWPEWKYGKGRRKQNQK